MDKLRKILKEFRQDNDLTQKQVAKLLNITQTNYSKLELDKRKVSVEELVILAKLLNVSTDYLAGLTDDKRPARELLFEIRKGITIIQDLMDGKAINTYDIDFKKQELYTKEEVVNALTEGLKKKKFNSNNK